MRFPSLLAVAPLLLPLSPAMAQIQPVRIMNAGPISATGLYLAPIGTAGGNTARQASVTSRQRSANGQPAGRSASSGTVPGIVASRVPRAAPSRGRAANRPRV